MAFKSFSERVSSFVGGNIQKSLNPPDLMEKSFSDPSIEKSSKAIISGFRDYDKYGQRREDETYRVSPKVMMLLLSPNAFAFVVPSTVPALMVNPVVNKFAALKVN